MLSLTCNLEETPKLQLMLIVYASVLMESVEIFWHKRSAVVVAACSAVLDSRVINSSPHPVDKDIGSSIL
ncbi:MAG: hypothetical protein ACI8PW_001143 [Methylophilaceae bacterium]|jgi:hypothetical protein